ncbi:MAG TPA: hypothetical protein VGM41_06725 [Chitinophagaceae bacterium]
MNTAQQCKRLLLLLTLGSMLAAACRNPAQKQDGSDVANDKNDRKLEDKGLEKQAALMVEVTAADYQSIQLA